TRAWPMPRLAPVMRTVLPSIVMTAASTAGCWLVVDGWRASVCTTGRVGKSRRVAARNFRGGGEGEGGSAFESQRQCQHPERSGIEKGMDGDDPRRGTLLHVDGERLQCSRLTVWPIDGQSRATVGGQRDHSVVTAFALHGGQEEGDVVDALQPK